MSCATVLNSGPLLRCQIQDTSFIPRLWFIPIQQGGGWNETIHTVDSIVYSCRCRSAHAIDHALTYTHRQSYSITKYLWLNTVHVIGSENSSLLRVKALSPLLPRPQVSQSPLRRGSTAPHSPEEVLLLFLHRVVQWLDGNYARAVDLFRMFDSDGDNELSKEDFAIGMRLLEVCALFVSYI